MAAVVLTVIDGLARREPWRKWHERVPVPGTFRTRGVPGLAVSRGIHCSTRRAHLAPHATGATVGWRPI